MYPATKHHVYTSAVHQEIDLSVIEDLLTMSSNTRKQFRDAGYHRLQQSKLKGPGVSRKWFVSVDDWLGVNPVTGAGGFGSVAGFEDEVSFLNSRSCQYQIQSRRSNIHHFNKNCSLLSWVLPTSQS